jgi:TolB-like protein
MLADGPSAMPVSATPILAPTRDRAASPDDTAVRVQLERILASEAFHASPRNRAFLRYVVDETLAGRGDRIKGYTIAQDVFQRAADFDSLIDPVVRIAAGRLRRSLERFYLTAGRFDTTRIDLPKGSYVPSFELRDRGAALDEWAPHARNPDPFLAVRPMVPPSSRLADDGAIAAGIAQELIGVLVGDGHLNVVAESGAGGGRAGGRRGRGCVLLVGARQSGRRLRVTAQLVDHGDNRVLRVYRFDHSMQSKHMWALQEEAARAIADAIPVSGGLTREVRAPEAA